MRATTIRGRLRGMSAAAVVAAAAFASLAALAGAAQTAPHFVTGNVSHVSGTNGQLQGTVVPMGIATSYAFEYGPNAERPPATFPNKTKTVAVPLPTPPIKSVRVGQAVTGLLPGYHYRIVGFYTNEKGEAKTIYGGENTLKGTSALKFSTTKGREGRVYAVYGGSAELTGTLKGTGFARHGLTLQETPYPFTAAFTTLPGTVLTNSAGAFTFKVANLKQSTEFRFATVDPRPLLGPAVTVHVTPRITLHVRRGGKTGLYRLYGTVTPARNGAPLAIQQLLPQKASSKKEGPRAHPVGSTVLKRQSAKSSRFSVIVKLSGTFHYRAYVRLPRGPLDAGSSSNVLIKAPAATTKPKK